MNLLKTWYQKHFQKTMSAALLALAGADLTPYAEDFQQFFGGHKWHAGFRLVLVGGILWRAIQAKGTP